VVSLFGWRVTAWDLSTVDFSVCKRELKIDEGVFMNQLWKMVLMVLGILALTACATRYGPPADVTDANALAAGSQAQTSSVQTQGLGNDYRLLKKDVGPHQGILGTRSFYFDFDSNTVRPDAIPVIKAHGRYLLKHPNARIVLEGNTDSRGSREYNVGLGQRRANAVAAILRMQGVPSRQVRTLSYGAEKPIALGHTPADYQMNRRVDLLYEAN